MKISDISEMFSMSPDTLRYYEKCGLLGIVQRTSGNVRSYDEKNFLRLQQIQTLKKTGMCIHDICQYVKAEEQTQKIKKIQLLKKQSILIQKELQLQFDYLKQTETLLQEFNQENENIPISSLYLSSHSLAYPHRQSDIL